MQHPQAIIEGVLGYSIAWDETAGWAQAFGAVVAIVVTAWFAHREGRERAERERVDDRRHAGAQRALAHSAYVLINEAHRLLQEAMAPTPFGLQPPGGDHEPFREIARALADFPIHTVEHQRVVEMVILARSSLAEARSALRSPLTRHNIGSIERQLHNCAAAVLGLLPSLDVPAE